MKIEEIGYEDPTDSPNWRWERVQQLVKDNESPKDYDDRFVWKGWHFLAAYEAASSRTEVYELSIKNRPVARAVGWNKEPGQRRYLIEALLLCRDLTEEAVANYLGESEAAIIYYQKFFFDVAERKHDVGYVVKQVFRPALLRKLHDMKDPDLGWKLAAAFGGFELVRSYWEIVTMPESIQDMCKNTGISMLTRNFCVGNFSRPVNKYTIDKASEQLLRYYEIEVKRDMAQGMIGGSSMDDKMSLMSEVLDSISFIVTPPDAEITGPRQPRLHEKLGSAAGELLAPFSNIGE